MTCKFTNKEGGFTLLELAAVISIITFGMLGMLALARQSIRVQTINKNGIMAAMLAQEGIELARNYRDNYWILGGSDWPTLMADGNYRLDYAGVFSSIGDITEAAAVLKLNGSGFYEHTNGSDTNFRRMITFSNLGSASSTVTCRVRYSINNNNYDYVAETVLYDWR